MAEKPDTDEAIAAYKELTKLIKTIDEIPDTDVGNDTYTKLEKLIKENKLNEKSMLKALSTMVKKFKFKSKNERKIVEVVVNLNPELITSACSEGNERNTGQTVFHIAVCKGNTKLVKLFLDKMKPIHEKQKRDPFTMRATGKIFERTAMMGEIPLSIAALTFNTDMMRLLLEHEQPAPIDGTNSKGDNVCHSLIRYAFFYPEKLDKVLAMFEFLEKGLSTNNKINVTQLKTIWNMQNHEGLTPLRLAAVRGQHKLFKHIMESEPYCSFNSKDGMFDLKEYDITEIDAISSLTIKDVGGEEDEKSTYHFTDRCNVAVRFSKPGDNKEDRVPWVTKHYMSVLMILLELDPIVAFHFILIQPVRQIIEEKWDHYKIRIYVVWMMFLIFTGTLIWYCIERAQQVFNSSSGEDNCLSGFDIKMAPKFKSELKTQPFLIAFSVIAIVFACLLLIIEILRCLTGRMPYSLRSFTNPYSNVWFRLLLVSIALLLIVDLIATTQNGLYENYFLLVAMILVCFCNIYFIRVFKQFSFVTVLITKVIIGDMFRFFLIIGIEIIAFATAMYMSIQGSSVICDDNFSGYGRVLVSMVTLMVGLGDTANFYETRHAELTIVIVVTFVFFTILLMLNSLIAVISGTCSDLFQRVGDETIDRHCHLQRLSMILFIESILPTSCIFKVGKQRPVKRYNKSQNNVSEQNRYFFVQKSKMDEDDASFGESASSSWQTISIIFQSLALTFQKQVRRLRKQVRMLRRKNINDYKTGVKPSLVSTGTQTNECTCRLHPITDQNLVLEEQDNCIPYYEVIFSRVHFN